MAKRKIINPILINQAKIRVDNGEYDYKDLKLLNKSVKSWQDDMCFLIDLDYKVSISKDLKTKREFISCVYPSGAERKYDRLYSPKERDEMYLDYKYILMSLIMEYFNHKILVF